MHKVLAFVKHSPEKKMALFLAMKSQRAIHVAHYLETRMKKGTQRVELDHGNACLALGIQPSALCQCLKKLVSVGYIRKVGIYCYVMNPNLVNACKSQYMYRVFDEWEEAGRFVDNPPEIDDVIAKLDVTTYRVRAPKQTRMGKK